MCPASEDGGDVSARGVIVQAAGATGRGRRKINADAFLVDEAAGLLAVADGMGDNPHAALVSRTALTVVREPFDAAWSQRPIADRFAGEASVRLARGLAMANRRLYERRKNEPLCKGATFAGVVVCRDYIYVAHVGDSRVFLLRRATGELAQLTQDHTIMGDLLARGMLQAAAHARDADVLTRALGKRAIMEVQASAAPWAPGDVVLACTDGLSDFVHVEAIRGVLAGATDAENAAQRLVHTAEELGGRDNATAAVGVNAGSVECRRQSGTHARRD
jgi:protein phosphatase